MIDLHCHLDLYPDPKAVAARCRDEDLFVLSVTTTPSAYGGTAALAENVESIQTALGLHPQLAAERHRELPLFDKLLPNVRWVGEVGLDGAPEFLPSWDVQIRVFQHILHACGKAGGRLLSIHSRRAAKAVLEALAKQGDAGVAILHWFSGTMSELHQAIELGCWFSVGLPMLRSKKGRSIVSSLPRNRVLTETDGPFAQQDGRPLYPWDIRQTTSELARVWNESEIALDTCLRENLAELVSLG